MPEIKSEFLIEDFLYQTLVEEFSDVPCAIVERHVVGYPTTGKIFFTDAVGGDQPKASVEVIKP